MQPVHLHRIAEPVEYNSDKQIGAEFLGSNSSFQCNTAMMDTCMEDRYVTNLPWDK